MEEIEPKSEEKSENSEKTSNGLSILQAQSVVLDFKKAVDEDGWLTNAEASWKRYKQQDTSKYNKKSTFPLWYSTAKIRQPLVFSKVPEIVAQPIDDDKQGFVTEVASLAEKLGNVLIKQFPFHAVASSANDDNLLTSLGLARVMVDAEFVTEPKREMLEIMTISVMGQDGQPVPQEQLVDSNGQPVDPTLVQYTYEGEPYIELEEVSERVEKETAFLKSVCYKEFIWDWEARDFSEWDYCGFRSRLTKRQVVKRFGAEALEVLPKGDSDGDDKKEVRRKYEVIELWWKPNKTRYIFAMGADDYLSVSEDPLKLENFFPIAYPLMTNLTTENSIPVTEYAAVKNILDHIDDVYDRKSQALRISRPRALYDSSVPELAALLGNTRSSSKDYIGVPDLATMMQQGSTFVQYLDTSPIINALNTYRTEFAEQLQAYDQITRLSDSVRGVTNPYESATATERKAQSVNHGIIDQQQDMQRWCRDSIKLLIDAALEHFSNERIFELLEPSLTDRQRESFNEMLAKLKNDSWRIISLDIETDSTILIDEDVDKQQAGELAEAIGGLLDRINQMTQNNPEGVPLAAELIHFVVSKYRGGKEFQDKIQTQIEAMMQAAQQRAAQAGQPPQPTPFEQFQMELAKNDQTLKGMKQQIDIQKDMHELSLKNRDLERKEFEATIDAQAKSAQSMINEQRLMLDQVVANFQMQLDQAQIVINDFKARAQAAESQAEEIRLARDTEISSIRTMIEMQKPQMPQDAQPPMIINMPETPQVPVNLTLQTSRGGRKVVKTVYDEFGNATSTLEEEQEL